MDGKLGSRLNLSPGQRACAKLGTKCCLAPEAAIPHPSGMPIPDEALEEFVEIYEKEFGEEINRTEATEMAHRVLALCRLLARMPRGQVRLEGNVRPHGSDRSSPTAGQTSSLTS